MAGSLFVARRDEFDFVLPLPQGIEQPDMGAVLDGTWQPSSTDGIHRWMGGMGVTPWSGNEKDNVVRTANIRTGINLRAADVLIDYAEDTLSEDYSAFRDSMWDAWRHLLFAEVSDATGINPWIGEVNYSLGHSTEADLIAEYVVTELKADLETNYAAIDTNNTTAIVMDTDCQVEGVFKCGSGEMLLPIVIVLVGLGLFMFVRRR